MAPGRRRIVVIVVALVVGVPLAVVGVGALWLSLAFNDRSGCDDDSPGVRALRADALARAEFPGAELVEEDAEGARTDWKGATHDAGFDRTFRSDDPGILEVVRREAVRLGWQVEETSFWREGFRAGKVIDRHAVAVWVAPTTRSDLEGFQMRFEPDVVVEGDSPALRAALSGDEVVGALFGPDLALAETTATTLSAADVTKVGHFMARRHLSGERLDLAAHERLLVAEGWDVESFTPGDGTGGSLEGETVVRGRTTRDDFDVELSLHEHRSGTDVELTARQQGAPTDPCA